MKNEYIIPVEQDKDGELMLTFPDELTESMQWKPGDVLEWVDNKDGSWTLRKLV